MKIPTNDSKPIGEGRLTPLIVGQVPDDWRVGFLVDVCYSINNGFVGESLPHQVPAGSGITYIQGFNVRANRIDLTRTTDVTAEFAAKQKKARLAEGDILTVQSGHIGTTAVVPRQLSGASCHAVIISRPNKNIIHPDFVAYYLNSNRGQRRLTGLHVGSTIKHINTSELARFRIPIPPLNEQIIIRDILTTQDSAIDKICDLITAKEAQKRALMQQLLTGKTRLPGFKEKWKTIRLEQISTRLREVAENPAEHLVLSITAGTGFVSQQDKFSRVIAGKQVENYVRLKRGEFAYNKGNSYRYPQGCVYQLTEYEEGLVPDVFYSFKLDDTRADPEFIKQYFLAGLHNKDLYRWINSGVRNNGLLNLSASDFFNLPIQLAGLSEQKEVGRVMKAADDEINALTSKLAGLKERKKGLMHKLLTGQIRVKV